MAKHDNIAAYLEYKTPYEACLAANDFDLVLPIKALFELKAQYEDKGAEVPSPQRWYPWQQRLIQQIDQPPDKRKVLWRWESVGGSGKSYLADWLQCNRDACVLEITDYRDVAHVMYNLRTLKRWKGNTIVFDLNRRHEYQQNGDIYHLIDSIKDRRITSGRDGAVVKFKRRLHVIVLATWPPNIHALSKDRLDVERIQC